MASTIARDQKKIIGYYLLEKQKGLCAQCGNMADNMDVDHVDGNPANNHPSNFQMLCRSCHTKKHIAAAKGVGCLRERERENATREIKNKVDYSKGSIEMQANEYGEIPFRDYVFNLVSREIESVLQESIEAGAEISGMSVNACRGYMAKMTSSEGPLMKVKSSKGGKVRIKFKPKYEGFSKRG